MPSMNKGTRRAADFGEYQHGGSGAEEERAGACSSHASDDTCMDDASATAGGKRYSETTIANGRRVLREATEWQEANPLAWLYIERGALHLAAEGRRVGARNLLEDVRAHDFADIHGMPTKTNNNYAPVFARQLIRKHPVLSAYIECRASVFDVIDVGECPSAGLGFGSNYDREGDYAD